MYNFDIEDNSITQLGEVVDFYVVDMNWIFHIDLAYVTFKNNCNFKFLNVLGSVEFTSTAQTLHDLDFQNNNISLSGLATILYTVTTRLPTSPTGKVTYINNINIDNNSFMNEFLSIQNLLFYINEIVFYSPRIFFRNATITSTSWNGAKIMTLEGFTLDISNVNITDNVMVSSGFLQNTQFFNPLSL